MRMILNAGGISAYPEGMSAVVEHFSGCRKVALIPYAYVGDPSEAVRFMHVTDQPKPAGGDQVKTSHLSGPFYSPAFEALRAA